MLLEGGHDVFEADTAQSGVEMASSIAADVVLGDVTLGRRDGICVMAAIRRILPGMPLIAISGDTVQEIRDRMDAAGLEDSSWCLMKPLRHDELLGAIQEATTG